MHALSFQHSSFILYNGNHTFLKRNYVVTFSDRPRSLAAQVSSRAKVSRCKMCRNRPTLRPFPRLLNTHFALHLQQPAFTTFVARRRRHTHPCSLDEKQSQRQTDRDTQKYVVRPSLPFCPPISFVLFSSRCSQHPLAQFTSSLVRSTPVVGEHQLNQGAPMPTLTEGLLGKLQVCLFYNALSS